MVFVIDIGNTTTIFGIYRRELLCRKWSLSTSQIRAGEDFLSPGERFFSRVKSIIISCVVPSVLPEFKQTIWPRFGIEPLIVNSGIPHGLKILYRCPEELGSDRIANAIAGYVQFGGPLIIIDFGTAVTFDLLDRKSQYIGGVILPGGEISCQALAARAEKLPLVKFKKPRKIIGKNTSESIQAGCFYGLVGQVKEILLRLAGEAHFRNARVIATGSWAKLFAKEISSISKVVPNLTLDGLRIIGERVKNYKKERKKKK